MNVYGDVMAVCVVVGGDDTIEYDVAPGAPVKFNTILVAVTVPALMLVTAVGAVVNGDDVIDPPAPLELADVIVKV